MTLKIDFLAKFSAAPGNHCRNPSLQRPFWSGEVRTALAPDFAALPSDPPIDLVRAASEAVPESVPKHPISSKTSPPLEPNFNRNNPKKGMPKLTHKCQRMT